MPKVGFVSLGCAKNRVDTEVMLGLLDEGGFTITSTAEEADVIVVNTCGFIDKAREESVDTILEMAQLKKAGTCNRLIVAGCLVERYRDQIQQEIPEVDAVIGVNEIVDILRACAGELSAPRTYRPGELFLYTDSHPRFQTTPRHTAYLKIGEGCDHPCAFCVIPQMRGKFRSRPPESIVAEAAGLAARGVRELNLVAQDSTMYGWDQGDRQGLANLLRALDNVDGLEWIRFLYAYPNTITDELLDAVAATPKVCNYIDIPLQHATRNMLARMKRGGNRASLTRLIGRIRERIPGVSVRTTMIVGFPGETDADFDELVAFVREMEFDRLGVFTYSDEEECGAFGLDQKVAAGLMEERRSTLMEVQSVISSRHNQALVGTLQPLLLEGPSAESDLLWSGRLRTQAPEIDGVVYVTDGLDDAVAVGEIYPVLITEAHDYDLVGTLQSPGTGARPAGLEEVCAI